MPLLRKVRIKRSIVSLDLGRTAGDRERVLLRAVRQEGRHREAPLRQEAPAHPCYSAKEVCYVHIHIIFCPYAIVGSFVSSEVD